VKQTIENFLKICQYSFTSRDIKAHIQKELSVDIPLNQIRKHLKSVHGLSYKRGTRRPITLDKTRVEMLQRLFSVMLINRIHAFRILVNVDETSLNYNTINHYSWSHIGGSYPIQNQKFTKSMNLISAISTVGDSVSL